MWAAAILRWCFNDVEPAGEGEELAVGSLASQSSESGEHHFRPELQVFGSIPFSRSESPTSVLSF